LTIKFSLDNIKPTLTVGIMRFAKKTQYGLRATVYLAKTYPEITSLKLVSEKEIIPFDYLEKIISELEKADIVKSKKGAYGGYTLNKKPSSITVGDIVRVLETEVTRDCKECRRSKNCLTGGILKKVEKSLNKTLDSIKLTDLA